MPKEKTLEKTANELLRRKLREVEDELKKTREQRAKAEAETITLRLQLESLQDHWDAAVRSIEQLAAAVTSTTRRGRNARVYARRALENHGIKPPSTLGSSRKSVKKRKKKKTA